MQIKYIAFRNYFISELSEIYHENEATNICELVFQQYEIDYAKSIVHTIRFISEKTVKEIEKVLTRLKNHEPIQYILQRTEFLGLSLFVDNSTLIPRPETEELVTIVLKHLKKNSTILDIGTGSGCIPLVLKQKKSSISSFGVDISTKALKNARKNAKNLQLDVTFVQMDILKTKMLPECTIMVSNPPYVTEKEKKNIRENVLLYEPHEALFVKDETPLVFYEKITHLFAKNRATQLFFECNEMYAPDVQELGRKEGYFTEMLLDFREKKRFVYFRKPQK